MVLDCGQKRGKMRGAHGQTSACTVAFFNPRTLEDACKYFTSYVGSPLFITAASSRQKKEGEDKISPLLDSHMGWPAYGEEKRYLLYAESPPHLRAYFHIGQQCSVWV